MSKRVHTIGLIFLLQTLVSPILAQPISLSNPSACGLNITLSDNNCPENNPNIFLPNEFAIQVSGVSGTALGVNVYLKEVRMILAHTWMSDVRISLRSPGGSEVLLTENNGGSNDHLGNPFATACTEPAIFSVGACTPVSQGLPPYTDRPYLPMQSLLLFNDSVTNPNGVWLLRICDDVPNDVGVLQYVELVFEPLSCLPITQKQILGVDTTTVVLDWSPVFNCGTVVIEYGPPGFLPGTGFDAGEGQVQVLPFCPPYQLSNLAPDTPYDIYIRRFCPGGSFSGNNCPVAVRTGCQPPPATIVETFDQQTPCFPNCAAVCNISGFWRNTGGDDFDWLVYQGPTPTPNTGPNAGVNNAGRYAYIETTGSLCNNGRRAFLESNCVRLRKFGNDSCHLSFHYHMFGTQIHTLRLEVSSDGGFTWSTLWQRTGNQGNQWHKVYLSLNAWPEGAILKFRFVGIGGSGSLGDIAIDQIVLHGSEDLGPGVFVYYADADGDGYGRDNSAIQSCSPAAPPGFVNVGGDCNDNNPLIHPGRPEVPCNNIDENCNGMADDAQLPPPLANGATICSGQTPQLCAQAGFGGFLLWYASPDGNDFVDFGECISPNVPPNFSSVPVTYYYYVEEFAPPCISTLRRQVALVVNPVPQAAPVSPVSVCAGRSLNLAEVPIIDNRFTGGTITFHSATPTGMSNQLPSGVVQPAQSTTYYFRITSPGGCTDEGPIQVLLRPLPAIAFSPADSFSLCKDGSQLVTAQVSGGTAPYQYQWNTGNQGSAITVQAGAVPGSLDTYQLTVSDALGCSAVASVSVRTTNSIDSLMRSVTHVSACGADNGRIAITPLNGLPPFNYLWSGNNGAAGGAFGIPGGYEIANLPQGVYRVTITDNSNPPCPAILRQIFVNGPDAVVSAPQITSVSCYGAADGSICVNASGQNITYEWSNGATTPCISGLSGGSYAVTIRSGACETVLSDLQVPEPDALSVVPSFTQPVCATAPNGAIALQVFGGTPPYSYLWSNGRTTASITGIAAGTYQVTISDARLCSIVRSLTLSAPPPLSFSVDSLQHPRCHAQASGYIRVRGTGGTPPYQYEWSNGGTSPVLEQVPAGAYRVTIRDVNLCQVVPQFNLTQPPPLQLHTDWISQPECVGNNNGAIRVSASGGTPPYRFTWSTGFIGQEIGQLAPGTYSVSLTDNNQCGPVVSTFTILPLSQLQLQIVRTGPLCIGRQDGSIQIEPTGFEPFSYLWLDNGHTQPLRTGLGAGEYPVRITDGRGCRFDTLIALAAPQVFQIQTNVISPACHDGSDGLVDLTLLQAGQMPYAFAWSNGRQSEDLIGVAAGAYTVTVTDALGCRFESAPVLVSNPPPLQMDIAGLGVIACHGDSSGFVEVIVSGGTPPYQVPALYGVPAGTYILQATDARSCPVNLTVTLSSPPPLQASISVIQSGNCQTLITTRLQAVVSGGVAPYRYQWSNGDTTTQIVNAAPGDYSLTVSDANGCVRIVSSIKVRTQSAPLAIASFTAQSISCFGAQDGALMVRLGSGTGPYRYHFSNNQIVQTPADSVRITGLVAGANYRVTVTDLHTGCVRSAGPVVIGQPQPLVFFRTGITHIVCFGDSTGAIQAATIGGTPPYRYQWFDAQGAEVGQEEDLIQMPAGQYTGIVTDARGCTLSIQNQLIEHLHPPIRLIDSLTAMSSQVCSGTQAGFISVMATGGAAPYQYVWSDGAFGASINGLPPGQYMVTVSDSEQCRRTFGPFHITFSAGIVVGINATPPDGNGANGAVQAVVSQGTPPYRYFWNTGDTTQAVFNVGPGLYLLTVTDAAGCTATASAILVNNREADHSVNVRLFPNPNNGTFWLEYAVPPDVRINRLAVYGLEGRLVHQQALPLQTGGTVPVDLGALPPGLYRLDIYEGYRTIWRQVFVILR